MVKEHALYGRMMRERDVPDRSPRNAGCGTCVAFRGTVGERASCSIYERRPQVCRDFPPGSRHCLLARRRAQIPTVDITTDGTSVWVNDSTGHCLGRFSPRGVDVHTDAKKQLAGEGECLYCTHPPTPPDWTAFVEAMRRHHRIEIATVYRPAWTLRGAARKTTSALAPANPPPPGSSSAASTARTAPAAPASSGT